MAISKEDIWAAADTLEAAGMVASLAAVRAQLGGGSFATIQPAMAKWRERKAHLSTPREPMPAEVQQRVLHVGDQMWRAASDAANQVLKLEREAMRAASVQLEKEQQEMATWADQLTAEVDAAKAQIATLETINTESAHELVAARLELVKAQAHSTQLAATVAQEREERREAQEGATRLRETLSRLEERVALLQGPRPSASSPGLATE
jgi:chromosome segregation ATPase